MYRFISIDYWKTLVNTHPDNKEIMWEAVKDTLNMPREEYDFVEANIKKGFDSNPQGMVDVTQHNYWVFFKKIAKSVKFYDCEKASVNKLYYLARNAIRKYKYIFAPGAHGVLIKLCNEKIPFIIASNCGKFNALNHVESISVIHDNLHSFLRIYNVKKLLNTHVSPFVLSGQLHIAKPDLEFFDEVLYVAKVLTKANNFNLKNDWLHIGDNPRCDIEPVLELGGDTLLIENFETDWLTRIPEKIWNTQE